MIPDTVKVGDKILFLHQERPAVGIVKEKRYLYTLKEYEVIVDGSFLTLNREVIQFREQPVFLRSGIPYTDDAYNQIKALWNQYINLTNQSCEKYSAISSIIHYGV